MIGCSPSHATARMIRLEAQVRKVIFADLTALAASGRPDRAVEAAIGLVRTAGRIAEEDPEGLRGLFRRIAETARATAGPQTCLPDRQVSQITQKGRKRL